MKYYHKQGSYELYRLILKKKDELGLTWKDLAILAECDEKKLYKWIALHKRAKVWGSIASENQLGRLCDYLGIKVITSFKEEPMKTEALQKIKQIKQDRLYHNAQQRPSRLEFMSRISRVHSKERGQ
jgi:hypothetical protein